MKKTKKVAFIALIMAALTLSGGLAFANLIVNGGFEQPALGPGSWTTYESILGWDSPIGTIEIQNNVAGSPHSGSQHVELDSFGNSSIAQTVTTVNNQAYNLNFYYSPRPGVPSASNGIEVFVGETSLGSFSAEGVGNSNTIWSLKSYTFVAAAGSTTITFLATGTNDSLGGYIDDVSLNAVPIPAAAWLLGSGLVGLVVIRRKFRK